MKWKVKSPVFLVAFGVILFAALMNLSMILQFIKDMVSLIFPILLGLLCAFVLNVPMRGLERILRRIFHNLKHQPREHTIQALSLFLTLICIVLVVILAYTMVIPEIAASVKSIYPLIEEKWPESLNSYKIDISVFTDWIIGLDLKELFSRAGNLWESTVNVASSTIAEITSAVFGMVIAIYVLLSKNKLVIQIKKLTYANMRKETVDRLCYIGVLARDTYSKFLFGQCMEAIILGGLIFVAFHLFSLPYAGLIGFLTGLFAFVPYVGALASCLIGVFLTLLVAPSKVIVCVVVYMTIQFIENQFIYPHVVGSSVGLAPLWTLIAALIGGKLFGVIGIIFFIPLTAFFYILIRDDTNQKLKQKEFYMIEKIE